MKEIKRTLVIGDIHGGLKSLNQVLYRSNYSSVSDKLIFLGDYVDGWSESAEVIEALLRIEESSTHKPIFLRGNHDEWCQNWLENGVTNMNWLSQGGKATYDSYYKLFGSVIPDNHRKFFRNLHNYYIDGNNNGFVHGGFNSRKGLGHETYSSDYYWDRDLWQIALLSDNRVHETLQLTSGISYSRRFENHKEIFIGHTSTVNWKAKSHIKEFNDVNQKQNGPITVPMNRCNVWNMDTGGGFYGKLTIMDINSKEYWQSDFVKDLYPEEKGR